MFLSSYRNTSGSFGEPEMLWKHKLQASVSTAFSSSLKLCWVFLYLNRNMENTFSISFRKQRFEQHWTTMKRKLTATGSNNYIKHAWKYNRYSYIPWLIRGFKLLAFDIKNLQLAGKMYLSPEIFSTAGLLQGYEIILSNKSLSLAIFSPEKNENNFL